MFGRSAGARETTILAFARIAHGPRTIRAARSIEQHAGRGRRVASRCRLVVAGRASTRHQRQKGHDSTLDIESRERRRATFLRFLKVVTLLRLMGLPTVGTVCSRRGGGPVAAIRWNKRRRAAGGSSGKLETLPASHSTPTSRSPGLGYRLQRGGGDLELAWTTASHALGSIPPAQRLQVPQRRWRWAYCFVRVQPNQANVLTLTVHSVHVYRWNRALRSKRPGRSLAETLSMRIVKSRPREPARGRSSIFTRATRQQRQ